MEQELNSTNTPLNSEKSPKPSAPSPEKKEQRTQPNSNTTGQKKESRNQKRKRWVKQNKPKQAPKPSVRSTPTKEYVSQCCSVQARKPRAGTKVMAQDADSGKTKSEPKGLGKWKCSACGKKCSVSVRKPETTLVTNIPAVPEGEIGRTIGGMLPA